MNEILLALVIWFAASGVLGIGVGACINYGNGSNRHEAGFRSGTGMRPTT